jgi:hypothetical protein
MDGSVGLLSLGSLPGRDAGSAAEERFRTKLRGVMKTICQRRAGARITLWFRSAHRQAAELSSAADMVACLFDSPAQPMTVSSGWARPVARSLPAYPPLLQQPLAVEV